MAKQIASKRTSFEQIEWDNVRELMPRKQATRGIQYEALEFLFDHLYERVLEEQLRDHFLEVKGHLQQKGDPVKSAINLAIKELQRLNDPKFEIIKIQEASLVGKTRRYVQLNFTGFDSVINYGQFCSYLGDMLSGEDLPILRSVFNIPPHSEPMIFPGIKTEWLKQIQAYALINLSHQIINSDTRTSCYFIPESPINHSFLLLYENEESEFPFLGFVSNVASTPIIENSQYIVYRSGREDRNARLRFLHDIWFSQRENALGHEEVTRLWEKAKRYADQSDKNRDTINTEILFKGLLAAKVQENWKTFIKTETEQK